MLAAMTSIELLAHSASAATPPFNSTFYATVAVLIPVLFLALAVQGRTSENLLRASATANRRYLEAARHGPLPRRVAAIVIVPAMIADLIVLFGGAGEIVAVITLYRRTAPPPTGPWVLAGTIFLIAAVAAGPFLTALRAANSGESPPEQQGTADGDSIT